MKLTVTQHRELLMIKKLELHTAKIAEKEARFRLCKLEANIDKYQKQIDLALLKNIKQFDKQTFMSRNKAEMEEYDYCNAQ